LVRYFAMRLGSQAAAEDVVQDIYVRIVSAEIGCVENPAAFLYRLGSNLMLDRLKQKRRAEARDDAWHASQYRRAGGEDVANAASPEEAAASRQRWRRLAAAIEDLPPQRRRAFELHKIDGLSHAETAAAMGISRSAVEKHISAALKHLLARLDK
jgi:RNA polymerase sigma-70 factor (ECF subfamily)